LRLGRGGGFAEAAERLEAIKRPPVALLILKVKFKVQPVRGGPTRRLLRANAAKGFARTKRRGLGATPRGGGGS
jgi:hypothetical protein